ncbi:MAG: elongation factor 4, partial [Bdellovibrionales bacterium]|nr:elongation factor 4 [Bdellovibrionales bacterium]
SPLEGFKKVQPMVFSGIFPVVTEDFEQLKKALEKLVLNDSSLSFEMETSKALGFGFRCGFLGLLHMEIVQERLEREFELNLITTAPTVVYKVYLHKGDVLHVENPSLLPDLTTVEKIEEPLVHLSLHSPPDFLGGLLKLCETKRGVQLGMEYTAGKVIVKYKMPLNEMVLDFHDRLKSLSKGYGSMEYELGGYEEADLVKMDILLNGEPVDALSVIVHRSQAERRGRLLVKKLREFIPRQQYQVAIQAALGARVIARETLSALRKDVTAKCYGGDITRKRKLLEKQKAAKKRMKSIGRIEVPQKAFLAILKSDEGH